MPIPSQTKRGFCGSGSPRSTRWHSPTSQRAELSRENPAGRCRHRWLPARGCGDMGTAGTGRWHSEGPALHRPKGFSGRIFGGVDSPPAPSANPRIVKNPASNSRLFLRFVPEFPESQRGSGHLSRGPSCVPKPGLSPCAGSELRRSTEREASAKTLLACSRFIKLIKKSSPAPGLAAVTAPGACWALITPCL